MASKEEAQYEAYKLRKRPSVHELGNGNAALHNIFGLDINKRSNLSFIEDDRVVYAAGNCVVFQNIWTKKVDYMMGVDENGVGCVAVHPTRKFLAVGGVGHFPKICIYSYPELKIVNVLTEGAERGYASLNFSQNGGKLASVGTSPDFMLTIWDWAEERVGLHSKAFGQDVFSVRFSLDDERRLTTSGTGHIRFWKMAATFTGLKLQGFIGKFGKVELSDIDAYMEMPDGKVVSGTEVGSLLLWEGNFIKCRFTGVGGVLCHEGEVTYVHLDRAENVLITGGKDGFLRFWDYDAVDAAEVDADISMDFELFPIAEFRISEYAGVGIHTVLDSGTGEMDEETERRYRSLVVLDTNGMLQVFKFTLRELNNYKLSETLQALNNTGMNGYVPGKQDHIVAHSVLGHNHFGAITCMDTSSCAYMAATGGKNGTIQCWNYVKREMLGFSTNKHAATCLRWVPQYLDPTGRSFAVGFADGVVRVYTLIGNTGGGGGLSKKPAGPATMLCRKMVFKPHNGAVTDMHFSVDGSKLATSGTDGIVFFFRCAGVSNDDPWVPLRFVTVSKLYHNVASDGSTVVKGSSEEPQAIAARANTANVNCEKLQWNLTSDGCNRIVLSCADGVVRELDCTTLYTTVEDEDIAHAEEMDEAAAVAAAAAKAGEDGDEQVGVWGTQHGGNAKHAAPMEDLSLETFEALDFPCRVAPIKVSGGFASEQLAAANKLSVQLAELREKDGGPAAAAAGGGGGGDSKASASGGGGAGEASGGGAEGAAAEGDKPVAIGKKAEALPPPKVISSKTLLATYQYNCKSDAAADIFFTGSVTVNMHQTAKDQPVQVPVVGAYSWSDTECESIVLLKTGVYAWDGKEAPRPPPVTNISYSKSRKFLAMGTGDGSVCVRPSSYPETFIRLPAHCTASCATSFSFDDNFVLSGGKDGLLVVYRLASAALLSKAEVHGMDLNAGVYDGVVLRDCTATQLREENLPHMNAVVASKEHDKEIQSHGFAPIEYDVTTASVAATSVDLSNVEDYTAPPAKEPEPVPEPVVEAAPAAAVEEEAKAVDKKEEEEEEPKEEGAEAKPAPKAEAEKPATPAAVVRAASPPAEFAKPVRVPGEVPDIEEGAYSIQDAKLKMEEDARRKEAEAKKDGVRLQVRQLQEEYEFTMSQNEALPEAVRVDPRELVVDHRYWEILRAQGEKMVDETHRECAYETEKAEKLRRKLMSRLMSGLLVEELPLYGFDPHNPNVVHSLRTRGLDPELREILNSVHSQVRAEELEEAKNKATTAAQRNASAAMDEMYGRMQKKEEAKSSEIISGGTGNGTSASARREMRRIRKQKLSEHNAKKPSENEDDPRDVRAISEAERTIGNYRLKCADDYEVPESQRTNVEKKRKQMAMLEESMTSMRLRFNERFIAMRELKRQMVTTVARDNERIREIEEELMKENKEVLPPPPVTLPSSDSTASTANSPVAAAGGGAAQPEGQTPTRSPVPTAAARKENSTPVPTAAAGTGAGAAKDATPAAKAAPSALPAPPPCPIPPADGTPALGTAIADPFLTSVEFADDRDEVTRDELEAFKSRRSKAIWKDVYPPVNHVYTGTKTAIVTNYHTGRYVAEQRNIDDVQFTNEFSSPDAFTPVVPDEPKPYAVNDVVLGQFVSPQDAFAMKQLQVLDEHVPVLAIAKCARKTLLHKPQSRAVANAREERRRLLLFERRQLIKKTKDNIRGFEEALEELRMDRHTIASDLKLAELKLLVLFQEYKLLETFEAKDTSLQQKQQRCLKEKAEIAAATTEAQGKLQAKQEEFKQWDDKVALIVAEFKQHIPENHPHYDVLTRIFKRKVKRSKKGGDDDDEEFEEEEEEDDDDDDDDDDEVDDACPAGCDVNTYEHLIDIREKRADAEDVCNEIQKAMDDFKKTIERTKQREKQIDKEARQTESEIQQFQLQKQAALNTIDVVVPLTTSQLYMFAGSGAFTGPAEQDGATGAGATATAAAPAGTMTAAVASAAATTAAAVALSAGNAGGTIAQPSDEGDANGAAQLRNCNTRQMVADMTMKDYALFSNKALMRLQARIGELVGETNEAKVSFKELHRERVKLERARDAVRSSIEGLSAKCSNLQMLKFGKLMDIDQLEAGNDKTKENEAQELVKAVEDKHTKDVAMLTREMELLREELSQTTLRSTALLSEVGKLTAAKQNIGKELNTSSGVVASQDSKATQHREIEERNRIAQYVSLQSREIEALKMELIMLKRKEAPQMMPYAGGGAGQGMTAGGDGSTMGASGQFPQPGSTGGSANNSAPLPPIAPAKRSAK